MRPLYLRHDIVNLKAGNLGDTKTAAAGKADDDSVTPIVGRPWGACGQIRQDGCKFTAAK
jgi:hypothetical protein